ncbi:MAG: VWA-like domain-containing protein [Pseudomonadota bacterium]
MVHSTRAALALAHLTETDPALGALALWCQHRDAPGGDTRTAGETIFYGPRFPLLSLPDQVGTAAHHVLHVALCHSDRAATMAQRFGAAFQEDLYNLAADGLVNDTLISAGLPVPRPAVRASELLSQTEKRVVSAAEALATWDADRLYLHLAARAPNRKGLSEDVRSYARSKGFNGDLDPSGHSSDGGDKPDEGEWRGRMVGALSAGRAAGTGIGALAVQIADIPTPRVPWELRLRRILAKATSQVPRQSHRRPASWWCAADDDARRHGRPAPVYAPGQARDGYRPRIVVGLDTSGSVADGPLHLFASEAGSIARRTGAEVQVLGFDTEVHTDMAMGPGGWDALLTSLLIQRGGGTDFRPVLSVAETYDPSLIVVLTDLDGPLGDAPKQPVLWAVPILPARLPSFGDLLDIGG